MRTGPTNQNTRKTILALEKSGKKAKSEALLELSERLSRPSRQRAQINVYRLGELAKKMQGKIFAVPGKVLSRGELDTKVEVACLSCSKGARQKIEAQKGKVITLDELAAGKAEFSNLVIVQ